MSRHLAEPNRSFDRRRFLQQAGGGLGAVALASILSGDGLLQTAAADSVAHPLAPRPPHVAPRARRVIYLFMHGGPSHVDLFDPKPELIKHAGQPLPDSFGPVMTRRKVAQNPLLAPVKPFRPRGESGLEISDFLPHLAELADELCVLRSCHGDSVNHPQSVYQMNTGSILMGRPSLGSWVSYGLGTENDSLPAFVVLPDPGGGIKGGPPAWGNGYLPATFQGTTFRPGATPILDLRPQPPISREQQRARSTCCASSTASIWSGARATAIWQPASKPTSWPFACSRPRRPPSISPTSRRRRWRCTASTRRTPTSSAAAACWPGGWSSAACASCSSTPATPTAGTPTTTSPRTTGNTAARTDKPVAGLLRDLRRRGLLDDTLVIWGGEFGRMPMSEQGKGRDHNPWGYSVWLAGAGVRGGIAYGATDPFGLRAAEDKVHVHDLHATILHLLGLDHESLTYFHNGRDERLTDVAGRVVPEILA